jgi:hypothetical protein
MKLLKNVELKVVGPDGKVIKAPAQEIIERLAANAPETDDLCPDCRGTGKVYGDPARPEKGVRDCTRAECVAKRRADALKARRPSSARQDYIIPDVEGF